MAVLSPIVRRPGGTFAVKEPDTYQGHPVLALRVGDAIPTPRIPARFVVRVTPDLARYWLDNHNHPNQRSLREAKVAIYAGDMDDGAFPLTPESLVFSDRALLIQGQNRLMAVTVHGKAVYMMVDFGWPDYLINYFDRGAARTNSDALKVDGTSNYTTLAAAIQKVHLFRQTVGTSLTWAARGALSQNRQKALYNEDPDMWQEAVSVGRDIYRAHHALSPQIWAAAFAIIALERHETAGATEFMQEIIDGTGEPGSPTRRLISRYTRIKTSDTLTGDVREPIENIVRAFNAYRTGKKLGFVTQARFTLTRPTTK